MDQQHSYHQHHNTTSLSQQFEPPPPEQAKKRTSITRTAAAVVDAVDSTIGIGNDGGENNSLNHHNVVGGREISFSYPVTHVNDGDGGEYGNNRSNVSLSHHNPITLLPNNIYKTNGSNNQNSNNNINNMNNNNVEKKSRKSFTIEEKIAHVREYKAYCQQLIHCKNNENQFQQDSHFQFRYDENNNNNKHEYQPNSKSNNESTITSPSSSSRNMAAWLRSKNERDGTNIARSTFFRWCQTYGDQIIEGNRICDISEQGLNNKILDMQECKVQVVKRGHKKRMRTRPFHEMESILIEILKVRNQRLRRQNKPISTAAFIRSRAEALFKDLYGAEASSTFKCSTGWLSRFMEHYAFELNSDDAYHSSKNHNDDSQIAIIGTQKESIQLRQQEIGMHQNNMRYMNDYNHQPNDCYYGSISNLASDEVTIQK